MRSFFAVFLAMERKQSSSFPASTRRWTVFSNFREFSFESRSSWCQRSSVSRFGRYLISNIIRVPVKILENKGSVFRNQSSRFKKMLEMSSSLITFSMHAFYVSLSPNRMEWSRLGFWTSWSADSNAETPRIKYLRTSENGNSSTLSFWMSLPKLLQSFYSINWRSFGWIL